MGLNGAHSQDSQDQSDNSKDSDFSRNEVESNSNVLADEFDDNYFDDDRSWAWLGYAHESYEGRQLPCERQFVCGI